MKCPYCEFEDETIIHALWECPAAHDVWGGKAFCFHKCSCAAFDFKALFEYVLHKFNNEQIALMAVISRRIWLRHNLWVFEGIFAHPNNVMNDSISAQDEYRRCMKTGPTGAEGWTIPRNRHSKWLPPSEGFIKVNWDASINAKQDWVVLWLEIEMVLFWMLKVLQKSLWLIPA
jgi:hypothetical protein